MLLTSLFLGMNRSLKRGRFLLLLQAVIFFKSIGNSKVLFFGPGHIFASPRLRTARISTLTLHTQSTLKIHKTHQHEIGKSKKTLSNAKLSSCTA